MTLTKEEVRDIAVATANEVVSQLERQDEELELRDSILGSVMGEGAIPLYGRETTKAPCRGCRIDPEKPFVPGNIMATTEGAIGTLSIKELRDWCSEIIEVPDGRCERVRKIKEAAKECREKYPDDVKKFFECYAQAWAAITKKPVKILSVERV